MTSRSKWDISIDGKECISENRINSVSTTVV